MTRRTVSSVLEKNEIYCMLYAITWPKTESDRWCDLSHLPLQKNHPGGTHWCLSGLANVWVRIMRSDGIVPFCAQKWRRLAAAHNQTVIVPFSMEIGSMCSTFTHWPRQREVEGWLKDRHFSLSVLLSAYLWSGRWKTFSHWVPSKVFSFLQPQKSAGYCFEKFNLN